MGVAMKLVVDGSLRFSLLICLRFLSHAWAAIGRGEGGDPWLFRADSTKTCEHIDHAQQMLSNVKLCIATLTRRPYNKEVGKIEYDTVNGMLGLLKEVGVIAPTTVGDSEKEKEAERNELVKLIGGGCRSSHHEVKGVCLAAFALMSSPFYNGRSWYRKVSLDEANKACAARLDMGGCEEKGWLHLLFAMLNKFCPPSLFKVKKKMDYMKAGFSYREQHVISNMPARTWHQMEAVGHHSLLSEFGILAKQFYDGAHYVRRYSSDAKRALSDALTSLSLSAGAKGTDDEAAFCFALMTRPASNEETALALDGKREEALRSWAVSGFIASLASPAEPAFFDVVLGSIKKGATTGRVQASAIMSARGNEVRKSERGKSVFASSHIKYMLDLLPAWIRTLKSVEVVLWLSEECFSDLLCAPTVLDGIASAAEDVLSAPHVSTDRVVQVLLRSAQGCKWMGKSMSPDTLLACIKWGLVVPAESRTYADGLLDQIFDNFRMNKGAVRGLITLRKGKLKDIHAHAGTVACPSRYRFWLDLLAFLLGIRVCMPISAHGGMLVALRRLFSSQSGDASPLPPLLENEAAVYPKLKAKFPALKKLEAVWSCSVDEVEARMKEALNSKERFTSLRDDTSMSPLREEYCMHSSVYLCILLYRWMTARKHGGGSSLPVAVQIVELLSKCPTSSLSGHPPCSVLLSLCTISKLSASTVLDEGLTSMPVLVFQLILNLYKVGYLRRDEAFSLLSALGHDRDVQERVVDAASSVEIGAKALAALRQKAAVRGVKTAYSVDLFLFLYLDESMTAFVHPSKLSSIVEVAERCAGLFPTWPHLANSVSLLKETLAGVQVGCVTARPSGAIPTSASTGDRPPTSAQPVSSFTSSAARAGGGGGGGIAAQPSGGANGRGKKRSAEEVEGQRREEGRVVKRKAGSNGKAATGVVPNVVQSRNAGGSVGAPLSTAAAHASGGSAPPPPPSSLSSVNTGKGRRVQQGGLTVIVTTLPNGKTRETIEID
uniref:Uncharacterized protein n=1 Tax=Palpitomonas bilix TaxID=652834 RepID=A0A7S3GA37_9EUKA